MSDRSQLIRDITGIRTAGRVTAQLVSAELSRITPRDRMILDLLADHQVLTTDQLADLTFGAIGRARNRLTTLYGRGVLDRFRGYQRPGSLSWRWTLGPVGAAIVAAATGQPLPRPSAVRETTARLATSPVLNHLLATNGFFVALAAYARTHPGARLVRWWPESACRTATGNLVRPDGHGTFTDAGRSVSWWLEMDQGTEVVRRVVGKLDDYARLAGTPRAYPVLIWLPTAAREANLHTAIGRTGIPPGVTLATATGDHAGQHGGPAGPVWRTPGQSRRVRLVDLPGSTVDGAPWEG